MRLKVTPHLSKLCRIAFIGCTAALGVFLLAPSPAFAGDAVVGACPANTSSCTSNDLDPIILSAQLYEGNGNGDCPNEGDTVDIELTSTMSVQSGEGLTGQNRYDIGVYAAYFPDLSSCGRDLLDAGNSNGVDADEQGDCLDINQASSVTHNGIFPNLPCLDANEDGQVDEFLVCHSWGNNGLQIGGESGCNIDNVAEGTGAKCFCQSFDPGISVPFCGDGDVNQQEEECDDGNQVGGDGCSSTCQIEECGNNKLEGDEQCDDGNTTNCDGCSSTCVVEECGNGVKECDEACDDGNTVGGDGCSSTCVVEECGNGKLEGDEECDDGNLVGGDGCNELCHLEGCGNGKLEDGEACDDGNEISCDGCSSKCTIEECGNGVLECTEACDDGKANGTEGSDCSIKCTEVPTMGEYGLGALALLLIGAGVVVARKGSVI